MSQSIAPLIDTEMDFKESSMYAAAGGLMAIAGNTTFRALGGFDKIGGDWPKSQSNRYDNNIYRGRAAG